MVNIKVVGPGCKNCIELEKRVKNVVKELQIEATITKISDFEEIAKSGILMIPALIINGNIAIQGKLPSEGIIKNYINEATKE